MRPILIIAGAALTLAACNSGDKNDNQLDTLAVNNLVVDDSTMMNGDMNAMGTDMNGMTTDDANAMSANTQELQQKDLNTNDRDTNLANGL